MAFPITATISSITRGSARASSGDDPFAGDIAAGTHTATQSSTSAGNGGGLLGGVANTTGAVLAATTTAATNVVGNTTSVAGSTVSATSNALDRTGWTLRGLPYRTESVAAHSFGVSLAAMLLADEIQARGTGVDLEKVLRMSLLHDVAETRVGDMPKTAVSYFGSEARQKAELAAFADVIDSTGAQKDRYQGLYEEYEARESLEARIVKAADIVDLLVQALALAWRRTRIGRILGSS